MRLNFRFFIFFIFFICSNCSYLFADNFREAYVVKFGKINIGELFLDIEISKDNYQISIKLKNRDLFSGLYKFEGNYKVYGLIKNGVMIPSEYNQLWLTKKKKRVVKILFNDGSLTELDLFPKENKLPNIKYLGIKNHSDPLSSFVSILRGANQSKTIDGRRIYSLTVDGVKKEKNKVIKKILIKDYVNIWANHNRNDIKYIEIQQESNGIEILLPKIIKIKFKGFLYKLTKI